MAFYARVGRFGLAGETILGSIGFQEQWSSNDWRSNSWGIPGSAGSITAPGYTPLSSDVRFAAKEQWERLEELAARGVGAGLPSKVLLVPENGQLVRKELPAAGNYPKQLEERTTRLRYLVNEIDRLSVTSPGNPFLMQEHTKNRVRWFIELNDFLLSVSKLNLPDPGEQIEKELAADAAAAEAAAAEAAAKAAKVAAATAAAEEKQFATQAAKQAAIEADQAAKQAVINAERAKAAAAKAATEAKAKSKTWTIGLAVGIPVLGAFAWALSRPRRGP